MADKTNRPTMIEIKNLLSARSIWVTKFHLGLDFLIFKNLTFFPHTSILTKNVFVGYFKSQISKCPDLSEILQPILAHIMPYRPSTKQILYVNHYETPCTI